MVAMILLVSLILLLFILAQITLSFYSQPSDPQFTVLESGFESILYSTLLSSSFFLLAVLFILFDMELILLFPCVVFHPFMWNLSMMMIISLVGFITITLLLEWMISGLKWYS